MDRSFRDEVLARCSRMRVSDMAVVLGISEAYAKKLRSGERGASTLSIPITKRALRRWPELRDLCRQDLERLMGEGEPEGYSCG